jgi:hypothetical protein
VRRRGFALSHSARSPHAGGRLSPNRYSSTLDCFRQIAFKEGPTQFYSGALARSARVLPGQGIIFMSAEVIYNLIEDALKGKK